MFFSVYATGTRQRTAYSLCGGRGKEEQSDFHHQHLSSQLLLLSFFLPYIQHRVMKWLKATCSIRLAITWRPRPRITFFSYFHPTLLDCFVEKKSCLFLVFMLFLWALTYLLLKNGIRRHGK